MSLESQESEMLAFAAQAGLEVVKVLRESQSAKAEGRPVFASLLAAIQAGEADAVLCWKVDRLARNMADAGRIIDLLQRGVIKQIRTYDATHLPTDNVLMLAVQLGMANQYSRDLSENVKRGNRTKLEQGDWPNRAPFGYQNDRLAKKLDLAPKHAAIVKRCFDLYVQKLPVRTISHMLTNEGYRTGTGKVVGASLVDRIVKNPFYMGVMLSHGKYYTGNHQPIISKSQFEQASEIREQAAQPKQKKHLFPVRGILTCANCSCMYTATLKKGHQYYYCTNGKGGCPAHTKYLRSEPAIGLVAEALSAVRFDPELIEIMYGAARERNESKYSYQEAVQKRLKTLLDGLEKQEMAAFEASAAGLLRKELYERKIAEIRRSRMLVERDIADLKREDRTATLEPTRDAFIQGSTAVNRFLSAEPEQQKIIAGQVLWNLAVKDGRIEEVRYRSFYKVLAEAPKKTDLENLLAD